MQTQEVLAELDELKRERAAHEEALRAAAAAKRAAEIRAIRLDAAAAAIQNAWLCFKKRRAAEAKAKAKGGKGGKGAGGKGAAAAAAGKGASGKGASGKSAAGKKTK